jgi:uncharacterized oxidoreductase
MNTTGNTILITGGGSGIGRGLAEAFHKLGNKVIIGGRREDVLRATTAANPDMEYITLDTSDAESIDKAASELKHRFPKLNVIINNAGIQRAIDFTQEDQHHESDIFGEIETNIFGVIRTINAFLPHLKQQTGATIINVTSGLAFVPLAVYPVYCATKAFVHSFTMSLREQLRNTAVDVIELAPPWVKTELDAHGVTPNSTDGRTPMPLDEFIAAAMQELATDGEELKVAGAKFLYNGGVSDKLYATFEQINK